MHVAWGGDQLEQLCTLGRGLEAATAPYMLTGNCKACQTTKFDGAKGGLAQRAVPTKRAPEWPGFAEGTGEQRPLAGTRSQSRWRQKKALPRRRPAPAGEYQGFAWALLPTPPGVTTLSSAAGRAELSYSWAASPGTRLRVSRSARRPHLPARTSLRPAHPDLLLARRETQGALWVLWRHTRRFVTLICC